VAVGRVKFWLGVVTSALTISAVDVAPQVWSETFVQTVQVEGPRWVWEPPDYDAEQDARCMIDLLKHLGLEVTVDNLFVVGDYADLQGGPCGLLP
jgi:hypothetical protein